MEQLPSGVKDRLKGGRVRCVEEEEHRQTDRYTDNNTHTHTHTHAHTPHILTHIQTYTHIQTDKQTHTHTHTHTHTPYRQSPIITQQVLKTMCDGIQCRLTARTGGSAEGEILAVQLGKEQTDRVKSTKESIKRGYNNKLQTVTDTQ